MAENKNKIRIRKKRAKRIASFLSAVLILLASLFLSTSLVFIIGMLPSIIFILINRAKDRHKAFTIASMNFSGCLPFLISLWQGGHSFEYAVEIITSPVAIVIMYLAAGVGYLINWSVAGVVSSLLYQKGLIRHEQIKKEKKKLIERWGGEVTGKVHMDQEGFAINPNELKVLSVDVAPLPVAESAEEE